jgi:hypothetical protein
VSIRESRTFLDPAQDQLLLLCAKRIELTAKQNPESMPQISVIEEKNGGPAAAAAPEQGHAAAWVRRLAAKVGTPPYLGTEQKSLTLGKDFFEDAGVF